MFWATIEGVVASVLLLAGGLSALQTMAIAAGLPFCILMMLIALGMWRALVIEGHQLSLQTTCRPPTGRAQQPAGVWEEAPGRAGHLPSREEVEGFMASTVLRACAACSVV